MLVLGTVGGGSGVVVKVAATLTGLRYSSRVRCSSLVVFAPIPVVMFSYEARLSASSTCLYTSNGVYAYIMLALGSF